MESTALTATLAVAAAVGCWLLVLAGHPVWAFFAAIAGLLLGFTGLFTGVTYRNAAGMTSLIAILVSLVGIALIGIMFGRIFL